MDGCTSDLSGAGAAAATTLALVADTLRSTARRSTGVWDEAGGAAAQAAALARHARALAAANADAFAAALGALRSSDPGGREALGPALSRAADIPLHIAELAADAAELAAYVADRADPDARADAIAAAELAGGAARAAAHLVNVNLAVGEGDRRGTAALRAAEAAAAASLR